MAEAGKINASVLMHIFTMSSLRPLYMFWFSLLCVFFVDQASKTWAMEQGRVTLNTGISFNLLSEQSLFLHISLTIIALGIMGWEGRYFWRRHTIIAGLASGAAISNLMDRVMYGGVRDFLPVPILNVHNNLADWVIFGCVCYIFVQIIYEQNLGSRK